MEHYPCYTVYINKNRSERVVETVDPPPQKYNSLSNQQGTWPLKRQIIDIRTGQPATGRFIRSGWR
jgi:hypothetical protein